MKNKKKQLEFISQAAVADADALSAVYQEVFTARLKANLDAIGANVVSSLAANQARISQQIVGQIASAYAEQAEAGAIQVMEIPMPKVRLNAPKTENLDLQSLLPEPQNEPSNHDSNLSWRYRNPNRSGLVRLRVEEA
jgi:hypothetical protein